jgi:hypothetical protein
MATNKIGKGTKTVGINMPIEEAQELERRAQSMHLSTGAYVKHIIRAWVKSGKKLVISE